MATAKITRRTLDALVEGGVAGFLSDQDLKDFGLRAAASRSSRLAFLNYADRFASFCVGKGRVAMVQRSLRLQIKPVLRDKCADFPTWRIRCVRCFLPLD
jgi:rRNA maturation endonuclease Nob1